MLLQGWIEHEVEFINPIVDWETEVQQNGRSMGIKEHLNLEHPKVIPQPFPLTVVRKDVWSQKPSFDTFDDEQDPHESVFSRL